jgi:hypothetical protein
MCRGRPGDGPRGFQRRGFTATGLQLEPGPRLGQAGLKIGEWPSRGLERIKQAPCAVSQGDGLLRVGRHCGIAVCDLHRPDLEGDSGALG